MFYDSDELIDLDIELNKVNQLFKIQSLGIDIDFLINQETNIKTLKFLYENGKGLDQDKFELLYRAKNSNLDDISFILDERYTAAQIKEILFVYENGKDYKLLLNPEYSKNKMKAYKHLLLADLLNEKTKYLTAQEAKQYVDFRKTIEDKSDIIKELFDNGYKPGAIRYLSFLESTDKECFNILIELVKDKIFGQEQLKAITAIIKNDEHIKDKNYDFYLDNKICASQIKKYHDYHEQSDINNTVKLRSLTSTLPSFCKDEFQRLDAGVAVVDLLRFRQFAVRHQARVMLQCVVALGAVGPALLNACGGPYFVYVLGHLLGQQHQLFGQFDAGSVDNLWFIG